MERGTWGAAVHGVAKSLTQAQHSCHSICNKRVTSEKHIFQPLHVVNNTLGQSLANKCCGP